MYRIKQSKNNFLKNIDDIEYENVTIDKENVIFNTNILPNMKYEILKDYKSSRNKIIKRKIGFFLGLLIFILLINVNSIIIKKIVFSSTEDYYVLNYVEDKIENGLLTEDLITLNHKIKKEFNYYEWINISKIGNTLFIDLKEQPNYKKVVLNEQLGDFYSSKEGLIKYFQIDKGLPLIEYNQYVAKGDLLVSGNLNYVEETDEIIEEDEIKEEVLVPPRGIIIAETYTKTIINIPKSISHEYLTGKMYSLNKNSFLGMNFTSNNVKYELYNTNVNETFNFLNIFVRENVKYYEKNVIIENNDKESSKLKLESYINSYFYNLPRHDEEKIVDYNILIEDENEEYYTYEVLIRSWEDITNFQKR